MIYFSSPPDIEYLESAGILERPFFDHHGDQATSFINGERTILANYEKSQPGMWSLENGTNSIKTNQFSTAFNNGTQIELHRCIPIPDKSVPLPEILEFRQRRRDELLLFRQHIESLAKDIDRSSDSIEELKKVKRNVDEFCSDLVKATREWQFPLQLSTFEASLNFNLKKAIGTASVTWEKLKSFELPDTQAALGAIAAAAGSQIHLKQCFEYRGLRRPRSPFKYAYSIQEQFF